MNGGFESDRLRKRKEGGEMRVYMNETNEWMKKKKKEERRIYESVEEEKKEKRDFQKNFSVPHF